MLRVAMLGLGVCLVWIIAEPAQAGLFGRGGGCPGGNCGVAAAPSTSYSVTRTERPVPKVEPAKTQASPSAAAEAKEPSKEITARVTYRPSQPRWRLFGRR